MNLAVSATAMTAITPAWTGSVTTRSAASGTLVAMRARCFIGRAPRGFQQGRIQSEGARMNVSLSADLEKRVQEELASGRYHDPSQLVEEAVHYFLEQRLRGQERLDALRRIGRAVDEAGLYERVLVPGRE